MTLEDIAAFGIIGSINTDGYSTAHTVSQAAEHFKTANQIVAEFRKRFYDSELFFDKYAKGKFANYLFNRHARENGKVTKESARQVVEEAQLFIEASHACQSRMQAEISASPA